MRAAEQNPQRGVTIKSAPLPEAADQWVVLTCHHKQAQLLIDRMAMFGGAGYYPTFAKLRRIPRRKARHRLTVAAFPGYAFTTWAGDQSCRTIWRRASVTARVLAMRREPVTLPRARLMELHEAEQRRAARGRPLANFIARPGARVRFTLGPFEGMIDETISADAWSARVDLGLGPVTTPTDTLETV